MNHDQFSLPFLDTTSLGGGFGLYDRSPDREILRRRGRTLGLFETPAPEALDCVPFRRRIEHLAITAHDYRLAGDRRLAEGWKASRRGQCAAMQLSGGVEAEGQPTRNRTKRGRLRQALHRLRALSDLTDKLFRRAGGFGFAPASEDLGLELEQLILGGIWRACPAGNPIRRIFTPEFVIRAIWRRFAADGLRQRPGPGTRLRNGPVLRDFRPKRSTGKMAMTGVEMGPRTTAGSRSSYHRCANPA